MDYPDHRTYAILYARYFKPERLDALLDGLPLEGNVVLDLCCGEGRVALEAVARGATLVFAVDECPDMIPEDLMHNNKIILVPFSVEHILESWTFRKVRVVVCQQAINYWLTRQMCCCLADVVEPGGIFAFNTFNSCPPLIPRTLSYELGGRHYWECSYTIPPSVIQHVQVCEGMSPHVTSFRWLSEESIRAMLEDWFEVSVVNDGPSSIYRCRRKRK